MGPTALLPRVIFVGAENASHQLIQDVKEAVATQLQGAEVLNYKDSVETFARTMLLPSFARAMRQYLVLESAVAARQRTRHTERQRRRASLEISMEARRQQRSMRQARRAARKALQGGQITYSQMEPLAGLDSVNVSSANVSSDAALDALFDPAHSLRGGRGLHGGVGVGGPQEGQGNAPAMVPQPTVRGRLIGQGPGQGTPGRGGARQGNAPAGAGLGEALKGSGILAATQSPRRLQPPAAPGPGQGGVGGAPHGGASYSSSSSFHHRTRHQNRRNKASLDIGGVMRATRSPAGHGASHGGAILGAGQLPGILDPAGGQNAAGVPIAEAARRLGLGQLKAIQLSDTAMATGPRHRHTQRHGDPGAGAPPPTVGAGSAESGPSKWSSGEGGGPNNQRGQAAAIGSSGMTRNGVAHEKDAYYGTGTGDGSVESMLSDGGPNHNNHQQGPHAQAPYGGADGSGEVVASPSSAAARGGAGGGGSQRYFSWRLRLRSMSRSMHGNSSRSLSEGAHDEDEEEDEGDVPSRAGKAALIASSEAARRRYEKEVRRDARLDTYFASSILVRKRDAARGLAGTPAYIAPCVARGEGASYASDYYALGVICFKLLCGKLPYAGKSSAEVLRQVSKGEIVWERLPRDTSPALLDLLHGLLLHGRRKRYGSNEAPWLHEHPFFAGVRWGEGLMFGRPSRLTSPDESHFRGPVLPSETFEDGHAARLRIRLGRGLVGDIRGMQQRRLARGRLEPRAQGQETAALEAAVPWLARVTMEEEARQREIEAEELYFRQQQQQAELEER